MGKKRKASSRNAESTGPQEVDPKDARLGPITTYKDVADAEDEFFINRDTLMLDDEPNSKRRRADDEDMELSDEEVYAYEDSDSDDQEKAKPRSRKSAARGAKGAISDEGEEAGAEEGEDSGWWGSSRKEYYNADNIETEADALEEEVEAKRLQQKKLSKMAEEDFIFDGDEWLAPEPEAEEGEDTVTEVLKEVEVTEDMSPEERNRLLQTRYPEFEHLVEEFQDLQPELEILQKQAQLTSSTPLDSIRYWILGCYVASLASYFAILTSPARDADKTRKPLDPFELRDHEVMETLVDCRDAWFKVRDASYLGNSPEMSSAAEELESILHQPTNGLSKLEKKKSAKEEKATAAKKARKLEKAKAIEHTVADLYDLPMGGIKSKKQAKAIAAQGDEDNSDFGEETALDARTAADKAARKKSLKFYTSQIVQKANKRSGAGRDAGGDMDIPRRERLRDRQSRLTKEAEKRGKKDSKLGADLGDDGDEEDKSAANALRDGEDEYYDMVAHSSKAKKEDKTARYAAYAAASKADRIVPNEVIGEDGKRKITYAIDKNKGLTPKRKKSVRNPRVKKREQYKARQKKLSSMKPTWKGGEPKGGYQGELSGINSSVVKSIKL